MTPTPWAILLCKFNDDTSEPQPRQYYEKLFTQTGSGTLNMVDFFSDASHGQLDLSGSQVFGWLTLDKARSDYTGSGANTAGRLALIDWARAAATKAHVDLGRFFGVVVYMNVATDLFGVLNGKAAVCDLNSVASQIAQEMGHGYGLDHSHRQGSEDEYADAWDVMSAMSAYQAANADWGFVGPQLNAANMASRGWLDETRTKYGGGTIDLRPLHRRDLPGFLAAQAGDVFIEYRTREKWDAKIPYPVVLVHRFADNHSILLPNASGDFGLRPGARVEYGDPSLISGSWTSVDVLSIDDNRKTAQVQVKSFNKGQRDHYAAIWSRSEGPSWRAVHGIPSDAYQREFDQLVAQGYRPTWVSGYGVNGQALYAAVFEQRGGGAWQARHGLTGQQYQQTFDQLVAQGYRPICVSGYSVNGQALFTAVFEQRGGGAWQARHGLTGQHYQQTFDQLVAQGYRPICVSGYGVNGQALYAAIFEQRSGTAWQARHGLTGQQYQQTFDQLLAQGYHPICVSGYDVNGQTLYAAVFEQSEVPSWQARHGLSSAQYQQTFDQLAAQGYRLQCVSGYDAQYQLTLDQLVTRDYRLERANRFRLNR